MFHLNSVPFDFLLIIAFSIETEARPSGWPLLNGPNCGIANVQGGPNRVLNGIPAEQHQFPWVGILRNDNSECTCSLIAENWALTAAHCIHQDQIDNSFAVFGVHHKQETKDPFTQTLGVQDVFFSSDGDIALLALNARAQFNDIVRPACLPFKIEDITGKTAFIKGFGAIGDSIWPSELMFSKESKIVSNEVCSLGVFPKPSEKVICTVLNDPTDPVLGRGDSGGPLDVQMEDGRYYQVGVASYTMEPTKTNAFMDVRKFLPWILEIVNSYNYLQDDNYSKSNQIYEFQQYVWRK